MKRILAIVLIFIHLLNIVGFYGLFSHLEILNNKHIASRLNDEVYAGSDAITLKIPLALPYSFGQQNYERVDGKFNYEGEVYRLVKQKLYNDTLYIVCVKDKKGTVIKDAIEDLASTLTDKPINSKSSSKTANIFLKDFETSIALEITSVRYPVNIAAQPCYTNIYFFDCIKSLDRPPQV